MFPSTPIPAKSSHPSGGNFGKHVCLLLVGCRVGMAEWVDSDWPDMILAPSQVRRCLRFAVCVVDEEERDLFIITSNTSNTSTWLHTAFVIVWWPEMLPDLTGGSQPEILEWQLDHSRSLIQHQSSLHQVDPSISLHWS